MLVIFVKSIITFFLILLVVRIMGKRQLGEMQPFELVIMLIIAEVACIPLNDPGVPIYAGVVPVVTLAFFQIVLSLIARKIRGVRKLLSGNSIIVIDKDGINYQNMKRLNMNIDDLIESARTGGYMDLSEIAYAIFETNGNLCVVEKPKDPLMPEKQALLPLQLIVDGKVQERNLVTADICKSDIINLLKINNIKDIKTVLYMDVRQNGEVYIAPKNAGYISAKLKVGGDW